MAQVPIAVLVKLVVLQIILVAVVLLAVIPQVRWLALAVLQL
jgi:hypothetical protein